MTEKDSIANVFSLFSVGVAMIDIQSVLTIVLLLTGIVLNVIRIKTKTKD